MPTLKFYLGEKGEAGVNGINGLSSADVNGFDVDQPLLDSFVDNQLSKNAYITSDRIDAVSFVDRYGNNVWTKKSESTNYITHYRDFSAWSDTFGRWSIIGATTDPFGGNKATEINLDTDTDDLAGVGEVLELTTTTPQMIGCVSFYVKVLSGDVSSLDFGTGSKVYNVDSPTGDYTRVVYPLYFANGAFIFSINPRGKSGARIALYGVQIEDNPTVKDLIQTFGSVRTKAYTDNQIRQSDKGVLIEDQKTNLVRYSNDLSEWTVLNGSVSQSPIPDVFGHKNQYTSVVFSSLQNISVTTSTDSLSPGSSYTVSFWAYMTSGSLQPITVSLGGGASVTFPTPSVIGFTRLSAVCVSGALDNLTINLESQALNAGLLISSVQVESGGLTSYKQTGAIGFSNNKDDFSMDYKYNFPKPSLPWSVVFGIDGNIDNDETKTIFSNGLTGVNEFSLTYKNRDLTINMGGNEVSADLFDYKKVALTYDGAQIKLYGEKNLILTSTLTSISITSSKVYIGYNGTDSAINAYLSNFMAYNSQLTENEIIYLMGV